MRGTVFLIIILTLAVAICAVDAAVPGEDSWEEIASAPSPKLKSTLSVTQSSHSASWLSLEAKLRASADAQAHQATGGRIDSGGHSHFKLAQELLKPVHVASPVSKQTGTKQGDSANPDAFADPQRFVASSEDVLLESATKMRKQVRQDAAKTNQEQGQQTWRPAEAQHLEQVHSRAEVEQRKWQHGARQARRQTEQRFRQWIFGDASAPGAVPSAPGAVPSAPEAPAGTPEVPASEESQREDALMHPTTVTHAVADDDATPAEVPATEESQREDALMHPTTNSTEAVFPPNEKTYVTVEALLLMCLTLLAVFFELFLSGFRKWIKSREYYGITIAYHINRLPDEGPSDSEERYVPMSAKACFLDLFNRLTAELMILGLLAFSVWCCVKAKDFSTFAEGIKYVSGIEVTPEELTEMTENIHMELFVAMVLLFLTMAWSIYVAKKHQILLRKAHNKLEIHSINDKRDVNWKNNPEAAKYSLTQFDKEYQALRFYFLAASRHVMQDDEPLLDLMEKPKDQALCGDGPSQWQAGRLAFDFSRYISLCLDTILEDLTEFSISTWLFTLIVELLVLLLAMHSPPDMTVDFVIEIVIAAVGPVVSLIMLVWAKLKEQSIAVESKNVLEWALDPKNTGTTGTEPPATDSIEKSETTVKMASSRVSNDHKLISMLNDKWPMRIVQAGTFFTCYSCTRVLCNARVYQGHMYRGTVKSPEQIALMIAIFVAIYLVQLFLQSAVVTQCTTVLALPPYIDENNAATARACSKISGLPAHNEYSAAAKALGVSPEFLQDKMSVETVEAERARVKDERDRKRNATTLDMPEGTRPEPEGVD